MDRYLRFRFDGWFVGKKEVRGDVGGYFPGSFFFSRTRNLDKDSRLFLPLNRGTRNGYMHLR